MLRRWRPFSRVLLVAAVTTLTIAAGGAMADEAVLLASTVPGYVPGMVVSASDRLSLPDGAALTLLFKSGEILRLHGPFEGSLEHQKTADGSGNVAMLADMFRSQGADAAVIGGTRAIDAPGSNAIIEDVLIDPQHSATYCVQRATSVWIGRPVGNDSGFTLRRKGNTRSIEWPAGSDRIEWPADVPIDDSSQFDIGTDAATRATVTFRALPTDTGSLSASVAQGIILGCHDQFDSELRRVNRAVGTPELWITTDHGRKPTYHSGDRVALTIVGDSDGYLYCVAGHEGGGAIPIFPAGAVDGAQLRGSELLTIPGRRQPAGLTADPALTEIRCWLADRDISGELPHALLGRPAARLPEQLAGDLDTVFSRVAGPHLAVASLRLHVDK